MANGKAVRRQLMLLLPVYANAFLGGCSQSWLSNAIYYFRENKCDINATMAEVAWMASFTEIGKFIFAFPGGILPDIYGRKNVMRSIGVMNFFMWLALSLSTSVNAIYVVRFVLGITIALQTATGSIMAGEIVSPEIRGKLVAFRNVLTNLGVLIPSVISIVFSSYTILTYSVTAVSVLSFVSTLWAIETPHFLIKVSRYEEAKKNLLYTRPGYKLEDVNKEFENLRNYIDSETKKKREIKWIKFVQIKSIRNPLLVAMALMFFQSLIGTRIVAAYITIIIPGNAHVPKKFYPLILGIVTLFPRIFMTIFIDKFPRRFLYIFSSTLSSLVHTANALTYYLYNHEKVLPCFWMFALGNLVVRIICLGCISPLSNTMQSEIFPQSVKGLGGALCTFATSLGDFFGFQMFYLIMENFGLHCIYSFYACSCLMVALIVYFMLPEGRAKSLVDIQQANSNIAFTY